MWSSSFCLGDERNMNISRYSNGDRTVRYMHNVFIIIHGHGSDDNGHCHPQSLCHSSLQTALVCGIYSIFSISSSPCAHYLSCRLSIAQPADDEDGPSEV